MKKVSAPAAPSPAPAATRRTPWIVAAALIVLTLGAYWGVGRCGFVNLDDDAYVEFQPMVNQGLRPVAVVWAFAGVHASNWHPLTSLSLMLDCELFGLRPAALHWENLAWHTLNALLVFWVWRALTGAVWRSALVAALFALHPLHVESVAWISERKDVLYTCCWLLGMGAYCAYARRPARVRYALVALCLLLSLLAKPMAVTFPCALLLLDVWPLRRWPERGAWPLLREKLPLFALVLAHSVATYAAQSSAGAADFGLRLSLGARLGNAVVSYARYLGKTVWPDSLAPFYAHPGTWPVWAVAGSALLLVALSVLAWKTFRAQPWVAFGWCWFLGTLVPAIGLVQVGAQAMADRYTYVPLLGIFTVIAWAAAALAAQWPRWRLPLVAGFATALVACGLLTLRQVSAWQNSLTLYEHAIAAGEDNATVRYLLGAATQAAGRPEAEAVAHYRRALEFEPDYVNASTQLAVLALAQGRNDEGLRLLETNVRLQPANPGTHSSLGAYYSGQQRPDEAVVHFKEALRLNPDHAPALRALAYLATTQNRLEEARGYFARLVRSSPWDPQALFELGTTEANLRQLVPARAHLERALWIKPGFESAQQSLDALRLLEAGK